jgi:4-hydroxythreonine-4-phosphate dehydrogenase
MVFHKKSVIGITLGDLNGIGPEIIVKALSSDKIRNMAEFVIFGTHSHLANAARELGIETFWRKVKRGDFDISSVKGVVLADYEQFNTAPVVREPHIESGRASLLFCEDGIDAALAGSIDALVTAPINKLSWKLAGAKWPGHTELLAERCGTDDKAMMFVAGKLKLALATIHEPLLNLRHSLDVECVGKSIRLLHRALIDYFGIKSPSIAVAALNPHAGEQGRFGDEEIRIIAPAIEAARRSGINALGPFPADTLFIKAASGDYDGVVAMYHDQGMIAVKLMAFDDAVNVTIGLPIIRTSPAHGTAFDIAGRGVAHGSSMKRAIEVATDMAVLRKNI